MLKCKDLVEDADAYLDGGLSAWATMQIRMHLWICSHCRRYMKQLAATIGAVQAMPSPEGPPLAPPVREELMTSFRSLKAGGMPPTEPPAEPDASG